MGLFYQEIKSSSIGYTFKINLWKIEVLAFFQNLITNQLISNKGLVI